MGICADPMCVRANELVRADLILMTDAIATTDSINEGVSNILWLCKKLIKLEDKLKETADLFKKLHDVVNTIARALSPIKAIHKVIKRVVDNILKPIMEGSERVYLMV